MSQRERWVFLGTMIISLAFLGVWLFLIVTGHHDEANSLFPIVSLIAGHFYGKYSGDISLAKKTNGGTN